jgi:hypothetical protein
VAARCATDTVAGLRPGHNSPTAGLKSCTTSRVNNFRGSLLPVRTVKMTLIDGDGGTRNMAMKTVSV